MTHDVIPCGDGIGGGSETIDDTTRYNDIITTALRTSEGIRLDDLLPSHREYLLSQSARHIDSGTLVVESGSLHLTASGIYVSDDIMSDLILI